MVVDIGLLRVMNVMSTNGLCPLTFCYMMTGVTVMSYIISIHIEPVCMTQNFCVLPFCDNKGFSASWWACVLVHVFLSVCVCVSVCVRACVGACD